jgi:hypothetical protein
MSLRSESGETHPKTPSPAESRQYWDLGCGPNKPAGWNGVDKRPFRGVDLVHDLQEMPWPFKDNQVERFRASHILEHIQNPIRVMEEVYRCLRMDGVIDIIVPSTDGRGAFQDPTHVSWWNINSFQYYCDTRLRMLYDIKCCFKPVVLYNVDMADQPMTIAVVAQLKKILIPKNVLMDEQGEVR